MTSSPLKNARVEFRVTSAQKETIEAAAAIQGRSLTDFSAAVLIERAQEVVQHERQLRVDADHYDAFLEIMDQPARSIDGLRDLMSRRSVFVD
ncbi:type II toxin-antitoxin system TacA family antitoxin [Microbacterium azadirachtae]